MRFVSIHMLVYVPSLLFHCELYSCVFIFLFRNSYINCYFLYRIRLATWSFTCLCIVPPPFQWDDTLLRRLLKGAYSAFGMATSCVEQYLYSI